MSPDRPVDLPRVRRALEALDRLADRYPGRVTDPPTPDDVAALAADLEHVMSDDRKLNERVGIRLAPELRERIERYRAELEKTVPAGVQGPSLSDACRLLILRGLDSIDGGNRG